MTIARKKSLKIPRSLAFSRQSGRCYYCDMPMWTKDPDKFSSKYKIKPGQAKYLQCTGEHLTPHKDGGTVSQSNIVAACWFCNTRRHRGKRKVEPTPEQYKKLVQKRMNRGGWHCFRLAI